MDTVRFGMIGAGFWAVASHVPAIRACPRAVLQAVCRRDREKLLAAQQAFGCPEAFTDWKEMIARSDLDAVIVCTPHDLHVEPAIAALRRGRHVLVEKPMAITGRDARAMAAAARDSGRVLMTTYNYRFKGLWRTAAKTLASGRIGTVRQVSLVYSCFRRFYWEEKRVPEPMLNWVRSTAARLKLPDGYFGDGDLSRDWRSSSARNGGGTFANPAAHEVDLAAWLAGSTPAEVSAATAPEGHDPEYFVSLLARMANGVHLSICFADAEAGNRMRLTVIGDAGMMASDGDDEIRVTAGGKTERLVPEVPDTTQVDALVGSILDGAPNLSAPADSLASVLLTEAAYRSAKRHAVVATGAGREGEA